MHFKFKGVCKVKLKGWGKKDHANTKYKEALLKSDKVDFRTRSITRDYFPIIKGPIHQKCLNWAALGKLLTFNFLICKRQQ